MQLVATYGIDPALMHRVAVIGAGSLDSLSHNGAVVTLLAVCGAMHKQSYFDILMVGIVSALLGLVAVIALGLLFGSFQASAPGGPAWLWEAVAAGSDRRATCSR